MLCVDGVLPWRTNSKTTSSSRTFHFGRKPFGFGPRCLLAAVCPVVVYQRRGKQRLVAFARHSRGLCEALLEWLQDIPGVEGLGGLRVGQSTYEAGGLGVFAAKDFAAGELVCRVPREALLLSGDGGAESLAEAYLRERSSPSSPFKPYWDSLPEDKDVAPFHPLQWPAELQQMEYVNDLLKGSLSAQRIFQERLKWASASPEMKAALVLVDSRSFNLADDQGNVIRALVPLIDLLNTFVPLTSTGSWNCWFRGNLQEGALLQAECPITEGSELVHCYSDFSSPELWATYGFLPLEAMESSHEAPLISLPLGDLKLISQAKKILQPRHWLDERTLAFEIPWDAEDGGPLFTVLNCMANGQQDRVQNILRERLQTALLASQQAEEALLAPTSGPHAAFKAALQQAALQLLHNERPLLEEELELLEG